MRCIRLTGLWYDPNSQGAPALLITAGGVAPKGRNSRCKRILRARPSLTQLKGAGPSSHKGQTTGSGRATQPVQIQSAVGRAASCLWGHVSTVVRLRPTATTLTATLGITSLRISLLFVDAVTWWRTGDWRFSRPWPRRLVSPSRLRRARIASSPRSHSAGACVTTVGNISTEPALAGLTLGTDGARNPQRKVHPCSTSTDSRARMQPTQSPSIQGAPGWRRRS